MFKRLVFNEKGTIKQSNDMTWRHIHAQRRRVTILISDERFLGIRHSQWDSLMLNLLHRYMRARAWIVT